MDRSTNRSSFQQRAGVYMVATLGMLGALWFASEAGQRGRDAVTWAVVLTVPVLVIVRLADGLARLARFEAETGCVPAPGERRAQRLTVATSLKSGKMPPHDRYDPLLLRMIDHQLTAFGPGRQAAICAGAVVAIGLYAMVLVGRVAALLFVLGVGAVLTLAVWWWTHSYDYPKRRARMERLRRAIQIRAAILG